MSLMRSYWKLSDDLLTKGYDENTIFEIINTQNKIDSFQKFLDWKDYFSKTESVSFNSHISDGWRGFDINIKSIPGIEMEKIINSLTPGIQELISYYEKVKEELLKNNQV
jgi:hypothetical protein